MLIIERRKVEQQTKVCSLNRYKQHLCVYVISISHGEDSGHSATHPRKVRTVRHKPPSTDIDCLTRHEGGPRSGGAGLSQIGLREVTDGFYPSSTIFKVSKRPLFMHTEVTRRHNNSQDDTAESDLSSTDV